MCKSISDGGVTYQSPKQFANLVGVEGIVWLPEPRDLVNRKPWRDMDSCLCHVDIEASLGRVGLSCERYTPDPMELRVVRSQRHAPVGNS